MFPDSGRLFVTTPLDKPAASLFLKSAISSISVDSVIESKIPIILPTPEESRSFKNLSRVSSKTTSSGELIFLPLRLTGVYRGLSLKNFAATARAFFIDGFAMFGSGIMWKPSTVLPDRSVYVNLKPNDPERSDGE